MSAPIGYLVPEFPSQTHTFFWREICALRARGADVRLFSTRRPPPEACRHPFAAEAARETRYLVPPGAGRMASWLARRPGSLGPALDYVRGLQSDGFRGYLKHRGILACALGLAEAARREGISHVHSHSCADAAHLLAISRRAGGPSYSLTLHGDLPVYGRDHREKMRDAAFVSAVGGHLRRQILEETGLDDRRVWVTCMGIETERYAALGASRSSAAGSLHLVTVARLNRVKGHEHAIAALKRAVDAGVDLRYTIAGEGEHRPVLEARIQELGLGERVRLVGTLGEDEVARLLDSADAFVLASTGLGEAWPVSVMEAMATGMPVVVSIIGATPEMITSGEDGLLIPQGDREALAAAFTSLARDPALRRRLGENGRRRAREQFDVRGTAGRLLDAIRSAQDEATQSQRSTASSG